MAIPDEAVAQVRAATDLVALVGEHVALKRQGRRWVGLCPFHSEKTPSFTLNAEEGLYYCFGCQAAGDAISFIRAVEHLDFVEAVERLAERTGIPIQRDDTGGGRQRQRRDRLLASVSAAVAWYHERLLRHPDAGRARDYLRSRGYDAPTVRAFSLGWAPDDWDALARALEVPGQVLADAGLGFVNRLGRQQDTFRARVLFPIFDAGGRPVAFGGRVLPALPGESAPGPKYKNSAETAIYSKRRTLYGLNWAKSDVVESGEVIVCEGYTDVIALFGVGLRRAVATCGTALGEEHFQMLRRFAQRVVLAYDADTAGQTAAERVYEWERRHKIDVFVAELPAGSDPADMARTDPDALRTAIAKAGPLLEFRLSRVLAKADLRSVEGRTRAAEAALAVVAEHPSELVHDQYVMRVAGLCRSNADQLRAKLRELRRDKTRAMASSRRVRTPRVEQATGPAGDDESRDTVRHGSSSDPGTGHGADAQPATEHGGPGIEALRLAVHRPEEVADRLEVVLFFDPIERAAFEALASSATLHEAITSAEPSAAVLLERLAVEDSEADADEVVTRLVELAGLRALATLESEAYLSDERALEVARLITWLRLEIEELRKPAASAATVGTLLPWLVDSAREDA